MHDAETADPQAAVAARLFPYSRPHLIGVEGLSRPEAERLLDLAGAYADLNRRARPAPLDTLRGRTLVNLFFESSTRTQASFEMAARRLGADVVNMSPRNSSVTKGETLIDTAVTLNAMRPDLLVVRHSASGAASLLSQKVSCAVVNAGDGRHEHPTQALLDALTLRRDLGGVEGLEVAICGDVAHSRVARSNVYLLQLLGARVRLVGPPTLVPGVAREWGCEIHHDMREGLAGADVVMMLRLQLERMDGAFIPSTREYHRFHGLDREKLSYAKPGAKVMHPGPMNRGVEIDSEIADDLEVSLIQTQVEMGVAVRMAVLASLAEHRRHAGAAA